MRGQAWARAIRVLFLIIVLTIAWLQLALPSLPNDQNSIESLESDPTLQDNRNSPAFKFLSTAKKQTHIEETKLSTDRIIEIYDQILFRSQNETIYNEEIFGPLQMDSIVIVVQVHNRLEYLRHLIMSLAQARHIEKIVLIFSHDFFDEEINALITTIDFCIVMQIFYPHSLQIHPNSYPGESHGDCPRDTTKLRAAKSHCVGNADRYGHYREARYTQTKHHWWWKANRIFDHLLALRNYTGLVLFLEEDHYVAEDFLHMLALIKRAMPKACPKCSIITLGNYLKNYNFAVDAKKVEISDWISSKHNMGFAFNHTVWELIKHCGSKFCNHDDYNWDWSLQHISQTCLSNTLFTLVTRAPRVFHVGECGVHHKKKDCNPKPILNNVYKVLKKSQRTLFPRQLIVSAPPIKKLKKHKGNGGWGDERDRELCRSFMEDTSPHNWITDSLVPDPIHSSVSQFSNNSTFKNTAS